MDITLIFTAIIGLIIGSFLNVVIFRYPRMLERRWKEECMDYLKQPLAHKAPSYNLMKPRSHCPKCRKKLKSWHNIPLISYLYLRGHCAFCDKSISPIYPIVELIAAAVAVIAVCRFGMNWQALGAMIFAWSLIVLSVIDYRKKILPDDITLTLLWVGLLANAFFYYTTPSYAILGALVGYTLLWSIAKLFAAIRKKEGMGYGDFKMFAMLGAWTGIPMLLNILLTSVLIALVVSLILIISKKISNKNPIPFGPYLAIGGWLTFTFGPTVSNWIASLVQYV